MVGADGLRVPAVAAEEEATPGWASGEQERS